ncbi:MAG: DUF4923 family protein [Bacteroidaceae bacterium]|jgi:hypothetical protein|nr:DUF4923 family protein [Bacteroidaceae bacterium]
MKKSIIKIALVATAAFLMPSTMNAQFADLLNKAKSLFGGSSSTTSTITNVVGNLLGNTKITAQKLEGTWSYTQPCIAFESESTLNNIGGSVASAKIEEKLKAGLDKAGIKEGQMSITFNADKTFYISTGKRQISGTYEVEGSDLSLTFKTTKKTIKTNVKLSLGTLQIAMNADKMLQIVNTIATKASAYSSSMKTVSTLLSQYKSMYLGLKFKKK